MLCILCIQLDLDDNALSTFVNGGRWGDSTAEIHRCNDCELLEILSTERFHGLHDFVIPKKTISIVQK